jgi:hypothetical protein
MCKLICEVVGRRIQLPRVLPGFRFRLADLLAQPADEALRDDPVYAEFVLAGWRADRERLRAEAERFRALAAEREAEQERHRAEQERRRAEELAGMLRALGLGPEEQAPPDS